MNLWLRVLLTPRCWLQNQQYDAVYDKWLRTQLDNGNMFTNISEHHADIKGKRLWIANHPYASFTWRDIRPSRRTILYAQDILMMSLLDEKQD